MNTFTIRRGFVKKQQLKGVIEGLVGFYRQGNKERHSKSRREVLQKRDLLSEQSWVEITLNIYFWKM